jgi:hypothetical protein
MLSVRMETARKLSDNPLRLFLIIEGLTWLCRCLLFVGKAIVSISCGHPKLPDQPGLLNVVVFPASGYVQNIVLSIVTFAAPKQEMLHRSHIHRYRLLLYVELGNFQSHRILPHINSLSYFVSILCGA